MPEIHVSYEWLCGRSQCNRLTPGELRVLASRLPSPEASDHCPNLGFVADGAASAKKPDGRDLLLRIWRGLGVGDRPGLRDSWLLASFNNTRFGQVARSFPLGRSSPPPNPWVQSGASVAHGQVRGVALCPDQTPRRLSLLRGPTSEVLRRRHAELFGPLRAEGRHDGGPSWSR